MRKKPCRSVETILIVFLLTYAKSINSDIVIATAPRPPGDGGWGEGVKGWIQCLLRHSTAGREPAPSPWGGSGQGDRGGWHTTRTTRSALCHLPANDYDCCSARVLRVGRPPMLSSYLLPACRGRLECGRENYESRESSRMNPRRFA